MYADEDTFTFYGVEMEFLRRTYAHTIAATLLGVSFAIVE